MFQFIESRLNLEKLVFIVEFNSFSLSLELKRDILEKIQFKKNFFI